MHIPPIFRGTHHESPEIAALLRCLLLFPNRPATMSSASSARWRRRLVSSSCGTVIEVDKGSITAGGREIPTITYQLRVSEQLKGQFPAASGGTTTVTIRSVNLKVIELPKLAVGEEYLLLTTTPSAAGLSTIVGLPWRLRIYGGAEKPTRGK